jgi:hypothetical protein
MAKDRFSRHKPINWNSGWKQTGSFIKPERKVEKKEYEYKNRAQHQIILRIFQECNEYINDWERTFMIGIRDMPFKLTPKQTELLRKIYLKYEYLLPVND